MNWLLTLFPPLLFAAARLAHARDAGAAWKLYERMLRDAWGGRVKLQKKVITDFGKSEELKELILGQPGFAD